MMRLGFDGRMMTRLLAMAMCMAGFSAMPAKAQVDYAAAGSYDNRDENGVDRVTGRFGMDMLEGSIGGDDGIALISYYGQSVRDNWSGVLQQGGNSATVSFGKLSEHFTKVGSAWVADKANGATLVETVVNLSNHSFTYRSADGTVITYVSPFVKQDFLNDVQPDVASCTDGTITLCAIPTEIVRPDGLTYTLSWSKPRWCIYTGSGLPQPGQQYECTTYIRLNNVNSSNGYRMAIKYAAETPVGAPPTSPWALRTQIRFLDRSEVYCSNDCDTVAGDWATVTYTNPSGSVREIVNSQDGTWRIDNSVSGQTRIRRPGATSDTVIVTRNSSGRTTSVTRDGETISYNWSTAGATTTSTATTGEGETDAVGSTPTTEQPTTVTQGTTATTTYTYDANKRLIRETQPEGNYTEYTRDARGNVTQTKVVAKAGSGLANIVTTANYDSSCGNPVKCNSPNWTQDALGNRTDYTYDAAHGQVTKIRLPSPTADAAGTETGTRPEINYSYTALYSKAKNTDGTLVTGTQAHYRVTQITTCATAATCAGSANETRVTIEYDNPNLLPTKVTTASGNGAISSSVSYAYDERDNLVSVDGPLSGTADTTTYVYDAQNRRRGVIGPDPDGGGARLRSAERYTFDSASRVTKIELGSATAATEAALNAMTVYQKVDILFDTDGNKVKETISGTSGAVSVTQYGYDNDNRLLCTALRMNSATWGSLPASACTAATTGSAGPDRITRNTYDNVGRVTKVETAVGTANASNEVTTAYAANGKVSYVIDGESNRTTNIYDGHDRLSQTRYPSTTKGANTSNSSDYEQLGYDAAGNVTSRRLRDGTTISYSYDDLGRVATKNLPGSEPDVTYAYDLMSRPTSVTQSGHTLSFVQDALGRLTSQTSPQGTIGYTYDAAGRRLTMSYPGGTLTINYDYDTVGKVTKIRENGATSGVGVLATYAFDTVGRPSSVTFGNGSVQSFGYDAVSRLSTLTNNLGGSATTHDLTQTFTYNPAGQIASVTRSNNAYAWQDHYNIDRTYLADGLNRIMNVGSTAFSYDARGNLTNDGTNAFTYTAENLLKTGPSSASLAYDPLGRLYQTVGNGTTTRFLYDGIDMIAEYNGSNAVQRRYVHGPGVDNPIAWYEGSAISSSTRRFLMADERGSIVSITDSSGATININAYDEFGIPASSNIGRFGYTGQMWLPEVRMWYYKARIFSPTLGRFMQTDPIGYTDGMNWYNYVGGDPVNFVDPLGLTFVCVGMDGYANNCGNNSGGGGALGRPPGGNSGDPGSALSAEERIRKKKEKQQKAKKPEYCDSWGYLIGDVLDNTGDLSQKVGTIAIAAGVVQVAAAPVTAGASGVTGGGTLAGGAAMISFGAALQTVGKFAKHAAAGGAKNSYYAADAAASMITLAPALSKQPTYALASQAAAAAMPSVGKDPCK